MTDTGVSDPVLGQVIPDGSHSLWIPDPWQRRARIQGSGEHASSMLRNSGGHLRAVAMPIATSSLEVMALAAVPHTARALGVGATYRKLEPTVGQSAVILEYR